MSDNDNRPSERKIKTRTAPPRRKAGTRGKNQIYEENAATLRFYRAVVLAAGAVYVAVNLLLCYDSSTLRTWLLLPLTAAVSGLCLRYMGSMAEATRHPGSGALLWEGTDLNAPEEGPGGAASLAVYLKDVILLTAVLQVLSTVWVYVWCFWLLVPLRAGYLLWRAYWAVFT